MHTTENPRRKVSWSWFHGCFLFVISIVANPFSSLSAASKVNMPATQKTLAEQYTPRPVDPTCTISYAEMHSMLKKHSATGCEVGNRHDRLEIIVNRHVGVLALRGGLQGRPIHMAGRPFTENPVPESRRETAWPGPDLGAPEEEMDLDNDDMNFDDLSPDQQEQLRMIR
jgi:hypothetical protein